MQLSMQVPYARDLQKSAARVAELEKAGLDIAWVAEAYGFDGVSMMGYLAAKTERIQIGSGILPVFTRTPTLLAMTAAGVDALSEGRCILGLGASGPQVVEGFHGVAYDKPLGRTREVVEICRKVWAREAPLTHDGRLYQLPLPPEQGTGQGKPLKIINKPARSRIPIYVASLGAKNVELTAEVADGWLPLFFLPEQASEVFGPALEAGFARRPDELGTLDIAAGGLCAIGEFDEVQQYIDAYVRPSYALYIGGMGAREKNFYNALVSRYGFEEDAKRIQDLYLSGRKDEASAAVPEELLRLTNLAGPESFVKERIAALREAGVTVLNVNPIAEDQPALVEKLKSWTS